MLIRNGKEYLNATESSEFLEISFVTFKKIVKEHKLPNQKWPGQGHQVFFLKEDLKKIRDTPLED